MIARRLLHPFLYPRVTILTSYLRAFPPDFHALSSPVLTFSIAATMQIVFATDLGCHLELVFPLLDVIPIAIVGDGYRGSRG